jgi:two-component system, NtrC family, response regulator AtoC
MADFSRVIGNSKPIRQVFDVMERVVQNREVSVLLFGETGTGKEIVARAIHDNSAEGSELFVEVNCAAIPEHLLESELFGYEKGAYTGADRNKRGLFELADGGTLLLDEIGFMSLGLQAKLLKAIEEKTFRRLGGEKEIQVKVRIIASTNVDLTAAMAERNFREDLFYRLNEIQITLPPLRDRGDDVILLANSFIAEFDSQYSLGQRTLSDKSEELLREYHWPGNVRELRNAIKRAMIMNDDSLLTPEMIPVSIRSTNSLATSLWSRHQLVIDIPEGGVSFEHVEEKLIEHTLRSAEWNKNQAARMLKISRPRLLRKIEKYGLESTDKEV